MEINQLIYLLKVVETQNFSKAAEQLFITQPTLSQQISKLEDEFGVKFIERTTRSFTITKAGEEFATHAREVIEALDRTKKGMQKYRSDVSVKSLKIGIFPTLSKIGMTKYIFDFAKNADPIKIELIENYSENLYSMIESKKIDLAIVNKMDYTMKDRKMKIILFPLIEDRIILLCKKGHPLSTLSKVSLEMACEYPVVKLSRHSSVSRIMQKEFAKSGIKPQTACECSTTSNMISIVDEGFGVSFLSETVASHYVTENTSCIKIVPKINNTSSIIALKSSLQKKIAVDFIKYLTDSYSVLE